MRHDRSALAALAVAAVLYGLTFVVIKDAVAGFPPLAFVAWRFAIGGGALAVLAFPGRSDVWRDALIAGSILFAGFALQTIGLTTTGAANSALLTGLYVVFTPLILAIGRRKTPPPLVTIGVVVAFTGIALLTATNGLRLVAGDALTLGCAVAFAAHVAFLSRAVHRHAIVPFTAAQLLVTAALAGLASLLFEQPGLPGRAELPALLLTGLAASALAFLLQIWAQTRVDATRAVIVLSLEPVFGVIGGMLLLGERLTIRGWLGAGLVLAAIQIVLSRGEEPQTLEAELVRPGA